MKSKLPQYAMISRLTQICELDNRVEAAMLYGSFAMGEEDRYSDIDVMLYFDEDSLVEIDQESWLNQIEPVAFSYINEFDVCAVVFNNLIRGEFHFDPVSKMAKLEDVQGIVWFPSLEKTILVDKTGRLTARVEKLIGTPPPHDNPQEALNLCKSFLNWLLFGINVLARGEFSRAHEILHMVHDVLLRMIRLVESIDAHWITPTKSLEEEISPGMYKRYQECTSTANSDSLARAYRACFDLGRELMDDITAQYGLSLPEELIDQLTERFSLLVRQ